MPAFTEFSLTSGRQALAICLGPDNNIWYISNGGASRVCKLVPSTGAVSEYACPDTGAGLQDIASDGTNLWAVGYTSNKIYKITTAGSFTSYSSGISASAGLYNICLGPDGNMWFTELSGTRVGKITSGGTVTEYSAGITASSQPLAIGSDGTDLWFTEYHATNGNRVCKITTAGTVTEYAIATGTFRPASIYKGPDNRMWVGSFSTDKVLAVTTATGARTEYTITTGTAKPFWIVTVGAGMYAVTNATQKLVPFDTSGTPSTEVAIPTASPGVQGRICTDGSDGIWFCEYSTDKIGTYGTAPAAPDPPTLSGVTSDAWARGVGTITHAGTGGPIGSLNVYRSQSSGGTYVDITSNCSVSNNGDATWSFTDKRPSYGSQPVAHGSPAYYKVEAVNGGGTSAQSGYANGLIDVDTTVVEQTQWDNLLTYVDSVGDAAFEASTTYLSAPYPGPWLLAAAYIAVLDESRRTEALSRLSTWWTYIQTNKIDAHHIFQRTGGSYTYRDDHFRLIYHIMLCVRLLRQITGTPAADSLRASMVAEADAMATNAIDLLSRYSAGTLAGYGSSWPTVAGATAWAATTVYAVDTIRRPTVATGRIYRCVVGGTSGGSEPTWPTTTRGVSAADGTCYWQECTTDMTEWAALTAYSVGDIRVPTTRNSHTYICTVAGTSGSSAPTWPTSTGGTVTDGAVTWKETSVAVDMFYSTYNTTYPYGGAAGPYFDANQMSEIAAALALLYNDPEATDFYTGGSYRTTAASLISSHADLTATGQASCGGIVVINPGTNFYDTVYGSYTLHTMAVTISEMGGQGWDPKVWAYVQNGLDWLDASWQTEPTIGNDVVGGHEAYAAGPPGLAELAWRNAAYQLTTRSNLTEKLVHDSSCHPSSTYTQAGQAYAAQVENPYLWEAAGVWQAVLGVQTSAAPPGISKAMMGVGP